MVGLLLVVLLRSRVQLRECLSKGGRARYLGRRGHDIGGIIYMSIDIAKIYNRTSTLGVKVIEESAKKRAKRGNDLESFCRAREM